MEKPTFSITCDNCDETYTLLDLQQRVTAIRASIEAALAHSLCLRSDEKCPRCKKGLRGEVVFPCNKHSVCFKCFVEMVEESLRNKKLLRCSGEPMGSCRKDAFYDLGEFEGRLRDPQIKAYQVLVLRKSEIIENERALKQLSASLYEGLYGNELLNASEGTPEYKQIPEYLNSLAAILQQIASKAEMAEFGVRWKTQRIETCQLLGCDNKAHKYRSLQVGEARICRLRCLKIHYAELPRSEGNLRTKSGQVLTREQIVKYIDVEDRGEVKTCMMCYDNFLSEELPSHTSILEATSAPCGHSICWKCLKDHLQELINARAVSDEQFKCPDPRCKGKFAPHVVQQAFPRGNLYNLYLQYRFELMTTLASNEIKVMCPQTTCQKTYVTEKPHPTSRNRAVTCPFCFSKSCCDCYLNYHPNSTCEQFRQALNSSEG